jgi:hypothetical protein
MKYQFPRAFNKYPISKIYLIILSVKNLYCGVSIQVERSKRNLTLTGKLIL